jgi:hypothetical protein
MSEERGGRKRAPGGGRRPKSDAPAEVRRVAKLTAAETADFDTYGESGTDAVRELLRIAREAKGLGGGSAAGRAAPLIALTGGNVEWLRELIRRETPEPEIRAAREAWSIDLSAYGEVVYNSGDLPVRKLPLVRLVTWTPGAWERPLRVEVSLMLESDLRNEIKRALAEKGYAAVSDDSLT